MHPYECMVVFVIKVEVLCRSDVHVTVNSRPSVIRRVERRVNHHVYFLLNALLFLGLFEVFFLFIYFFCNTRRSVHLYIFLKH